MGQYVQLSDGKRVYVDLEPSEESMALAFSIATEAPLSPKEFAQALAGGDFVATGQALLAVQPGANELRRVAASTAAFYLACRNLRSGRSRAGRHPDLYRLGRPIDFAVLVCYFKSVGVKQASKAVASYWVRAGLVVPAKSKLKPAQRQVDRMVANDLHLLAKVTCASLGIREALPSKTSIARRHL